jgi:hypothetical protein
VLWLAKRASQNNWGAKKNYLGKTVEVKRSLSKLGGASQLEDKRYVARVLARAKGNKNKGADLKAQNRRQSAVSMAAKKAQAADRAASSRKETFDDETRDAVTAESNPAVLAVWLMKPIGSAPARFDMDLRNCSCHRSTLT